MFIHPKRVDVTFDVFAGEGGGGWVSPLAKKSFVNNWKLSRFSNESMCMQPVGRWHDAAFRILHVN